MAVIGGSEDGKTFLTSGLVRGEWRFNRRRAIVFDPWKGETDWGVSAWVTDDFEKFRRAVAGTRGCCVVWDEGTSTGGRARDNVHLFTAIRHLHPSLYFIGHSYAAMLPIMRGSLTGVLLAVRDADDANEWAKVMVDESVRTMATRLAQYEFLYKRKHQPARVVKFTPEEIKKGIRLSP
ncbi:hypothetical protein AW736_11120 [Termitidicoccus mucosus]|uniref:Uncharacterized protein n=2 Tax=Termitidicoccus mucosus TaxID=1184151 RepID=A0A178IIY9_9BACT|nr:hypothetical protein AW736_11120 [Opitutaceae bacterium TSB47]